MTKKWRKFSRITYKIKVIKKQKKNKIVKSSVGVNDACIVKMIIYKE